MREIVGTLPNYWCTPDVVMIGIAHALGLRVQLLEAGQPRVPGMNWDTITGGFTDGAYMKRTLNKKWNL
jgi:hypothetical protein